MSKFENAIHVLEYGIFDINESIEKLKNDEILFPKNSVNNKKLIIKLEKKISEIKRAIKILEIGNDG